MSYTNACSKNLKREDEEQKIDGESRSSKKKRKVKEIKKGRK